MILVSSRLSSYHQRWLNWSAKKREYFRLSSQSQRQSPRSCQQSIFRQRTTHDGSGQVPWVEHHECHPFSVWATCKCATCFWNNAPNRTPSQKYGGAPDEINDNWTATTSNKTDVIVFHRFFQKHADRIGKESLSHTYGIDVSVRPLPENKYATTFVPFLGPWTSAWSSTTFRFERFFSSWIPRVHVGVRESVDYIYRTYLQAYLHGNSYQGIEKTTLIFQIFTNLKEDKAAVLVLRLSVIDGILSFSCTTYPIPPFSGSTGHLCSGSDPQASILTPWCRSLCAACRIFLLVRRSRFKVQLGLKICDRHIILHRNQASHIRSSTPGRFSHWSASAVKISRWSTICSDVE